MLSPTIPPAAARAITNSILSLPWLASTAAVISPVSPGTGTPLDSLMTIRNRSGEPAAWTRCLTLRMAASMRSASRMAQSARPAGAVRTRVPRTEIRRARLLGVFGHELLERRGGALHVGVDDVSQHDFRLRGRCDQHDR